MNDETNDLLRALDAVTGRSRSADVPAPSLARARALVAARRRVLEQPACPVPVLRRVQALFRERRTRPTLLALVFDSFADLAPAYRGLGRPRTLRFERGGDALDLRLVAEPDGIRLQIAVEPARAALSIDVVRPDRKRATHLRLDEEGVGMVRLPGAPRSIALSVQEGDTTILETPPLFLE